MYIFFYYGTNSLRIVFARVIQKLFANADSDGSLDFNYAKAYSRMKRALPLAERVVHLMQPHKVLRF